MRQNSFKFIAALLLLALSTGATAQDTRPIVTVGVFDNPPIALRRADTLHPEASPQYAGIALDVLRDTAARYGWRLRYRYAPWKTQLKALKAGRIDVLVGMAYTEARAQQYRLSRETLISNWGTVYARPDTPIDSLLTLKGKRVALMQRSIHSERFVALLKRFGVNYTPVPVATYDDAMDLVATGKADAAVVNRLFSLRNRHHSALVQTSILFNPVEVRYAVAGPAQGWIVDAIDSVLAEEKSDPGSRYYASLSHWLNLPHNNATPPWVKWLLLGVSLFAVLVVLLNTWLRAQIKLRTSQLDASEERFRATFEHAAVGIAHVSPDGRFLRANQTLCHLLGYPAETLLTLYFHDITHPDDLEADLNNIRRMLDGHLDTYAWEKRYIHHDGDVIWVSLTCALLRDDHDRPDYLITVIEDITARKREEQRSASSERKFRALFENANDAIFLLDSEHFIDCNSRAETMFGLERAVLLTKHPHELSPLRQSDGRTSVQAAKARIEAAFSGTPQFFEWQHQRSDGSVFDADVALHRIELDGQYFLQGMVRDITERKQAEQALRESERRFRDVVNASGEYVWEVDTTWHYTYVSERLSQLLGDDTTTLLGRRPHDFVTEDHRDEFAEQLDEHLCHAQSFKELEHPAMTRNGELIWLQISGVPIFDDAGKITGYRGTGQDITERKQTEARIEHLATRDPLTELPNRLLLSDRLDQAIIAAQREHRRLGFVFIDLDRFKNINDSLGHHVGDSLLKAVALRLEHCIRRGDTLSRLGGDEFVILLEGLKTAQDASPVINHILNEMTRPFEIENHNIVSSCSIGISIYPDDGEDMRSLLRNADTAMYHAKERGRNKCQFFSREMNARAVERFTLESALRQAVEREEFVLHYQPQIDIASGQIIGVEALIRWLHPTRGLLLPHTFIPIAEDTGLIAPIGDWLLHAACAQARAWQDAGHADLRVAINLSADQVNRTLIPRLIHAVEHTGVHISQLEFEITESLMMHNIEDNITVLNTLGELGAKIAIDDFGTGFSSLNYLKRFPIDSLKIDQSFVRDVVTDPDDATIIRTIIAMAHSLLLDVVAEGVENKEQLIMLREMNCMSYQGYYFSPPLPAQELTARYLGADSETFTHLAP